MTRAVALPLALLISAVALPGSRAGAGPEEIRGLTIAPIEDGRLGAVGYGTQPCARAMREARQLGARWISLTPFGRMDDLGSTEIRHDFEIPVGENEERLRRTARQARAEGLKVALIPHLWVISGAWRGEIEPTDDDGWRDWFDSYDAFVLRWARLAEEIGADLFSIGVEFKSSSDFHEARWRRTIDQVRAVYRGPLTYSANWDEAQQVPFWDALDLIGINAFWPLAHKPGDGFDVMTGSAKRIARQLEALSQHWNRPVLFTEFGFKSARDSAVAPWEWPEHLQELVYDEEYQAAAYQALLERLCVRPWFAGFFVWKYFSDPEDTTQEAPAGFSPRRKRAEEVLRRWLARPWGAAEELLWPDTGVDR